MGGETIPGDPNGIWSGTPSAIDDLLPLLRAPHSALVDKAAGMVKTRTQFFQTHSPGVLAYLEQEMGVELPEPDYGLTGKETTNA